MTWDSLVGQQVGSGWLVAERKKSDTKDTGGNFSVGFFVKKGEQLGFMKVFDIDRLMKRTRGDPTAMGVWIQLFEHECKLLKKCQKAGVRQVVAVLERGAFQLPSVNPSVDFQFLIFEVADADLRRHYNYSNALDLAFALTVAKHMAKGLGEIHGIEIAHQDVKPSNILLKSPASRPLKNSVLGSF